MDYEKKYNEALNWMRELYPGLHGATKEDAEHYFPELRESEDERIRKWLVDYFSSIKETVWIHRDITCGQILAWLEKQKEPKKDSLTKYVYDKDDERFINDCANILTGDDYQTYAERLLSMFRQKHNIEICPHSIKSKSYKKNGYPIENCDYGLEIALAILEKTLGEVQGYQTDDGLREHQTAIKAVKDAMKGQKPAEWSEEDEFFRQQLIVYCEKGIQDPLAAKCVDWLKSLRPSWKPNEEQMDALQHAIDACESEWDYQDDELRSLLNDIKKL